VEMMALDSIAEPMGWWCIILCGAICAVGCALGCGGGCVLGCQVDTPIPGPADVIAAGIAIDAVGGGGGAAAMDAAKDL